MTDRRPAERASRGPDSTHRLAPAKAALLALLLLAGAARTQDAGKDDDVLDWLSGPAPAQAAPQAPAPAPPAAERPAPAPPAGDGGVLDWLGGVASTPPPGELVPPPAPATAQAPKPVVSGKPSPAAGAFAEQLKAAMTLEIQAQDYENSTLGMEADPESLQGYRKQRWQRMQKDKESFRQRAGQMSLQGLDVPRTAAGVELSRDAAALLSALQRGYEATRATGPLVQYMDANRTFIENADWVQRDRAVVLRDEIVEREISFSRLMQDAATIAGGGEDAQLLAEMTDTLDRVAPESRAGGDDVAVLVLKDKKLREEVLAEVSAELGTRKAPAPAPAPDEELRPKAAELWVQLIEKASLAEVVKEHSTLGRTVQELDTQLETDLPLERKKDLLDRRTTAVKRTAELEQTWYSTKPDPETFEALTQTQDELIRRRLLDLGPAGVLYGQRAEATHEELQAGQPDPAGAWRFVQKQQDLLTLLDGVKPVQNPLSGVVLPDQLGAMLMEDAALRVAQEQKIMAQSAPKPKAKKKSGGGGGAKASAASKPPPKAKKPKKKPMPKYKKPPPKKKGKKK